MRISGLSSDVCSSDLLDKRGKAGTNFTFHEKVGFKVLGDYVDSANAPISDENVVAFRNRYAPEALDFGGIREISADHLASGRLPNPQNFFRTRASVRDYSSAPVPSAVIEERSEARSVGKECVSTCRSRWSPYH